MQVKGQHRIAYTLGPRVEEETLIASGGICMPVLPSTTDGREYDPTDRMRSLFPAFNAPRGGIRFTKPGPTMSPEESLVHHQRMLRRSAWNRRVAEFCVCIHRTSSNGDWYEDETYRVDHSDCPVHGIAERRFDDD